MPSHPTGARPWPTEAAYARDATAEILNSAATDLERIVKGEVPDDEYLMLMGTVIVRMHKALRLLESEGAKTRPHIEE